MTVIINDKEVPVTANLHPKMGQFLIVKFKDLGAPGGQGWNDNQIPGDEIGKYINKGDKVMWDNQQWKIWGIEVYKTMYISECAIAIRKTNQ